MDVVLDELTLVECGSVDISARVHELARTLVALDKVGAPRNLRSVSDAQFRPIADGLGLSKWCFDKRVDRDAGRLVASRISLQPFVDGHGGLLQALEGEGAVECQTGGQLALGLGYCYIVDGVLVGLQGSNFPCSCDREVTVYWLTNSEERQEVSVIRLVLDAEEVDKSRADWSAKIQSWLRSGVDVLERASDVLPRLKFGDQAVEQLSSLTGSNLMFASVKRHLVALQEEADRVLDVSEYNPKVSWSVESETTLEHPKYGSMRRFPWPRGFDGDKWSNHSKTGGYRIYFAPVNVAGRVEVCIGYIGRHLPTTKFPN